MRTCVLCILALSTWTAIASAECTSTADNSIHNITLPEGNAAPHLPPGGEDVTSQDVANTLLNAFNQMMQAVLRLQQQEAERAAQQRLRLQEQIAATALREAVCEVKQQLQERDDAMRALLDERLRRVETKCVGQVDQQTPSTVKEGCECSHGQLSNDQLGNRLIKLERMMQRMSKQLQLEDSEEHLTEPSSISHASSSTFISATSAPNAASVSPSPSPDSAVRATTNDVMTTEVPMTEEELDKQRVERRIREAKERQEISRAAPSQLGEDLCEAAFDERLEDVRSLLDSGADVNYTSIHGHTPLTAHFYYIDMNHWGNVNVVSLLLERRADVNAMDASGLPVLHHAVYYNSDADCVPLLLTAGAMVNDRDENGATALHWAAYVGNEEAVRALLAAGARTDVRCWSGDWMGRTPFDVAGAHGFRHLLRP